MEMQAVAAPFLSDDGTAEKAVNAQLWLKTLCEGSAKFGKPIDCAPAWKAKMIAAGFENVQEEIRKVRDSKRNVLPHFRHNTQLFISDAPRRVAQRSKVEGDWQVSGHPGSSGD